MLDFNSIVGHEQIKEHLQNAIKLNKVSHAYILNGEKGSGKKMLAYTFAKVLQCDKKDIDPCGVCKSCIQAESMNQPDIITLVHEKASIGVDDIRTQINNDIAIKPYSSPYKIYIIDEADKMTEQAQNALLKTIEEPPAYAVILLLTSNANRLLPTILSRCVTLNLKTISTELIKNELMVNYHIPDYLAELSAIFSQGNLGKAIRYASSEEFTNIKEEVLHILKYIDDMEIYEIIEAIKKLSEHKLEINDYIDFMILWYRDVLMFKVTKNPNVLIYREEYKFISKQASMRTYEGIEAIVNAMDKAKVRLNANVNFDIAIELMLLTLKENGNG
ncbi:DNA polymerase III subunit delta' [Anaeromicropila herbilytica]|uniref:DNA polymerase III subunit delta n=1 Tax=Anaeromicropila herbilytica TaxID=2785025 RepID=A0A7R7EHC9_9FIRM|nr:DNA polymerase III subunit delta' [Anaeromicropila herbilytica]BCN28730.1 DNA polymerase III subunit delta' [Anaeromicropila herbilytica]